MGWHPEKTRLTRSSHLLLPPWPVHSIPLQRLLAGKPPSSSAASATIAPTRKMATFILFVLFLLCRAAAAMAESAEDKAALLSFLALVPHEPRLRWNTSASACTWVGVRCDAAGVRVVSLRLPGVGLAGRVPPATVGRLTALRALSLRSNRLAGEIPADLANLTRLRGLYLQNNVFSGGFPAAALLGLRRLARLDLSGNRLGGEIPVAINNLPDLALLFLQGNNFSGELPSIGTPSLISFDVSDNDLRGPIPGSLSRFPASAFAGNLRLCGPPLSALCGPSLSSPPPPPPPDTNPIQTPTRRQRSLRRATVIAITIAATTSAVIILLLMLICCLRRRRRRQPGKGAVEAGTTSSSKDHSGVVGVGAAAGGNKLVFMEGGGCSFDLEDLLRASAEVLGKGGAGTTYKAVLEEGTTVVVKRLKEVAVGRREFEQQMEAVGRVKHPNVVPLRAFYFSKDEKLLVSDFMAAGSLSALLHGSRGSGRTPLDWDTRVRIAAAAGRGIAHLHATAGAPHGNIKASNVLLRPDLDAAVSDFGLAPLFSPAGHPRTEAGYRAPEVSGTGRPTVKSDVYSYGVLLLELLTGKSPAAAAAGEGEGVDLPRWVTSVVREEWTAEVFDAELVKYQADIEEEEMMQLLQVAMTCVAASPDLRPEFSDVVRSVEDLARSDDYADGGGSPSASRTP